MSEETYECIPRDKIPWDPKIDYEKLLHAGNALTFAIQKNFIYKRHEVLRPFRA